MKGGRVQPGTCLCRKLDFRGWPRGSNMVVDAFEIINLWHKYALTRNIDVYLVTAYDLTYRRTRDKVE